MLETAPQIRNEKCLSQEIKGDRDKLCGMMKDFTEQVKLKPELKKIII